MGERPHGRAHRWETAKIENRPFGRTPTWERGSDGKMGPHGKNEPIWGETDRVCKNDPTWEKVSVGSPDRKLSKMRICPLPRAKREPKKMRLVH